MKNLISLLFVLVLSYSFYSSSVEKNTYGMPVDPETGKIIYTEVVNEKGDAGVLFDRAYSWAKAYFPNFSSAIKTRDHEAGLIEGNTRFKVHSTDKKGKKVDAGIISFDFKIEFKDGKYRVICTKFTQADNSGNAVEEWFEDTNEKAIPIHEEIFKQIDAETKNFIASLKVGMKPTVESTDEW